MANNESKILLITGAKGGPGNVVTSAFPETGAQVMGTSQSITDAEFPFYGIEA